MSERTKRLNLDMIISTYLFFKQFLDKEGSFETYNGFILYFALNSY